MTLKLVKPSSELIYPLNQAEVATLLGGLDLTVLTIRQERINANLTLLLVETPRKTFSIFTLDKGAKKIYVAERDTRFQGARVFESAVQIALYGFPKNPTFRKTDRSK